MASASGMPVLLFTCQTSPGCQRLDATPARLDVKLAGPAWRGYQYSTVPFAFPALVKIALLCKSGQSKRTHAAPCTYHEYCNRAGPNTQCRSEQARHGAARTRKRQRFLLRLSRNLCVSSYASLASATATFRADSGGLAASICKNMQETSCAKTTKCCAAMLHCIQQGRQLFNITL